jgi:pimeloyl-ACP methyl ester carboxylesterase
VRRIPTAFGDTNLAITGPEDGEPVLFIHGWSCNGMLWEVGDDLHMLAERYRVMLVDVIGQPGLSSLSSPPVRGSGYARWLAQLLDAVGVERTTIVGMSFGGFLAVKLAEFAGQRVSRVVLLGPAGFVPITRSRANLTTFLRPIFSPTRANVRNFVNRIIISQTHPIPSPTFEQIVDLFELSFRYFRSRAQLPYVYQDEVIEHLAMPTMLLIGGEDALFDAQGVLFRAKKVLPNLHHGEILDGYGHAITNTHLVMNKVAEFLDATR